jgi:hypothetical protein
MIHSSNPTCDNGASPWGRREEGIWFNYSFIKINKHLFVAKLLLKPTQAGQK